MRILHAYNQHRGGGGADNAARATIDIARENGHEVEVFTRSSEDLPPNLGGRLQAGISAIYAPDSVRRFDAILDSFKPDLVHVHEVFPLVSPWILPGCTRKVVPVVMTTVDYRMTCPVGTHLRRGQPCDKCAGGREHWAVLKNCRQNLTESVMVAAYNTIVRRFSLFDRHVRRFIAPSEFTRRWLTDKAGIDAARITSISPLVEIPVRGIDPAAGQYVGYAGRFSPEKGIDILVQAGRLSDVPIRMSRNMNGLLKVAVPLDIEVDVTSDRHGLADFYRGARMLVVPSLGLETFGLVGAEAMSHGVPVIASRIGALAELIEDGVDGLLFEPGNVRDLADKITRLWNDADLCRRLGCAARAKAVAYWGSDSHLKHLMAVYDSVCDNGRDAAVAAYDGAQSGVARQVEEAPNVSRSSRRNAASERKAVA
jgi:glycosyltransferase involved in cell wall biosynthesis